MLDKLKFEECSNCDDWTGCITDCFRTCIKPVEALEEFNQYKDLEKQGKLIRLPCAMGDTAYTNASMQGWYFKEENRPYKAKIVFIGINGADNYMNVDFGNGRMLQFNFSEIGKTVFLTKEDAQKALEKIRAGSSACRKE